MDVTFSFFAFTSSNAGTDASKVTLPVLVDLEALASGGRLMLGAGGMGSFGSAKARYVVPVYSRDFSDFSLAAHAVFVSPPNETIQAKTDINLDLTAMLVGEFGASCGVRLSSYKNLPKEMGVMLRYNHNAFRWRQYSIGVNWDFGQNTRQSAQ